MYQHSLRHIKKSNSKGFTLIELVVTISVAGVLSVVIASIMSVAIDSYNLFNAHATMSRESQDAVRVMSEKIGMAIPSTISEKTTQQFRFTCTNGQQIRFEFRTAENDFRYRLNSNSWRVMIHNLTGFTFSYLKDDGSAWLTGDPLDDIQRINLVFGLSYLGETQNYSASFTIRN